jgi:hypothetical protein
VVQFVDLQRRFLMVQTTVKTKQNPDIPKRFIISFLNFLCYIKLLKFVDFNARLFQLECSLKACGGVLAHLKQGFSSLIRPIIRAPGFSQSPGLKTFLFSANPP